MRLTLICLFVSLCTVLNAQSFRFQDYFPLKADTERVYAVSRMQLHTKPQPYPDAHIWCRSENVKGRDIFYFDDKPRTTENRIIGSNIFLAGVCYYDAGILYWSPIFWKEELDSANLSYFEPVFPEMVKTDTVYRARDAEKKISYRFMGLEDQTSHGVLIKDCLKLTVLQDWKTAHYEDTVWLKKGVGVVRWMRSTGRLEEIRF